MSIPTQGHRLLNAQKQFNTLKRSILDDSQPATRIDQVERNLFADLMALDLTLLKAFVAAASFGDEGKQVSPADRTLHRSAQPHPRLYHSILGKLPIRRWLHARAAKKNIEHAPTDVRLGLPHDESPSI